MRSSPLSARTSKRLWSSSTGKTTMFTCWSVTRKGLRVRLGEQPEGCLQPIDPEEKTPANSEKPVGRIALVPQLFCRKLWGSPHRCDSPIHRTAEDATLKATTGTAMPSALSFPAVNGELCRAIGSKAGGEGEGETMALEGGPRHQKPDLGRTGEGTVTPYPVFGTADKRKIFWTRAPLGVSR